MLQAIVLILILLTCPVVALSETTTNDAKYYGPDLAIPLSLAYPRGSRQTIGGFGNLNPLAPSYTAQLVCAPDSPCSDAQAVWPLRANADGFVNDHQMSGQFVLILPLGILFLLTLLLGPGTARRKYF